ncbi:preprotein translocase subunit SecG [Enterobacteriaceae bacterium LUAb1]
MYEALLVVFLLVAIGLVGLIMLQQGKGADMGASFGAGASGTLFGSTGSGNFITRMTAVLATLFFIISLILGNINSNNSQKGSEWENLTAPVQSQQTESGTPAAPAKPGSDIPE